MEMTKSCSKSTFIRVPVDIKDAIDAARGGLSRAEYIKAVLSEPLPKVQLVHEQGYNRSDG